MESVLFASFIAGFLTVLAPCLLPLLPVVIGGSLVSDSKSKRNPYVIIGSLLVSVVAFTIIIQVVSLFFFIPDTVWRYVAATLILFVGATFLLPSLWFNLPFVSKLSISSNTLLGKGAKRKGLIGDVLIGASLGPVFTSCSPTYFIILAIVLQEGALVQGLIYLLAYAAGLGVVLLFIALIGQTAVEKLGILANESGWFKKTMGIIIVVIAVMIYTGYDKKLSAYLLDYGFFDASQYEFDISR